MTYIVHPGDDVATLDATALFGGKGRALASLTAARMPVPQWFAIATAAWRASLTPEQQAALSHTPTTDDDMTTLRAVQPSDDVVAAIDVAVRALAASSGDVFAVRSSAADEDAAQQSFAGQLESYLFVSSDQVADRVAHVWASAFTQRAAAYRRNRGLGLAPVPPVVLVQRMIDADVSGVAFSADPVSGARDIAVVSAVFGLGTALVSGEADADTFKLDRAGSIVERIIADKRTAHRRSATGVEGVEAVEVAADRAKQPALDDAAVRDVAQLARRAEQHFGAPQDIEWAYHGGRLHLLQARPITSLAATAARAGDITIWDNSNIAESYGGITTPLTFTFAQHAYDSAYRQFFRLLSIPDRVAAAHDETFRNMLGLIRGRIYYNLLNWYRLLALLPGFRINRRFMEQMMGVKEALPESVLAAMRGAQTGSRFSDTIAVARTSAALVWHHLTLRARMRRFYRLFDEALASDPEQLASLDAGAIAREYRRLEQRLVNDWDAPLINDFFAMIFYGLLRRGCSTWCGDSAGTLQNDLLCGQGGMVSTRPAAAIRELAAAVAADPALVAALANAPTSDALEALREDGRANELFERYMREFGDRCDGELKLESPTLRDDPSMLLRAVGRLASQAPSPSATAVDLPPLRGLAEQRVAKALARSPLRRATFAWILKNARGRIVDRENLRFARTRLFGRIRAIFIALGTRFAEHGSLREPRDIFYLELGEVLGAAEAPPATVDLKARVAARKEEFERYRQMPAPPDRFVTRGTVDGADVSIDAPAVPDGAAPRAAGETRTGIGCCPGVVRGTVRVVRDPHVATLHKGDVLVAERTDPSWVMLFPACSGILVERGSLLSHAAIVAREMGIPAIVSIAGLTSWLNDGDQVEFDGASGVLTRIQPAAELAHAQ